MTGGDCFKAAEYFATVRPDIAFLRQRQMRMVFHPRMNEAIVKTGLQIGGVSKILRSHRNRSRAFVRLREYRYH